MHSEPPAVQAESWVSVSNSFTEQLFQFTLLFCSVEAVRDLSLLHPAPFYHIPYHCWWHFWWFFLKGELIHDIAKKPSQVTNRIIMENIYKLWLKIHMQAFLFYLLFFYYIPNCWILFHFLYCQTEPPEFSWCYSHCILFRVIGIICFPVQKLKTVLKCF